MDEELGDRVAVHARSGERRVWVQSSRILDAVVGAPVGSLEARLHDAPWWNDPTVAPLVALIDLIRRGLVEARGHVGRGFDAPADPIYSECRRLDRPRAELLAEVAAIDEPGATVTIFDPRPLVIDGGLGPVRLGAALPCTLEPPWSLAMEPRDDVLAFGDGVLQLAGEDVAAVREIDGVVAMISPLVHGMPVVPGVTCHGSAAAVRAQWGAALVAEPASNGRRAWHRDHPEVVVWLADDCDVVMSISVWSRDHLARVWLTWDPGVTPELLQFVVTCGSRVVIGDRAGQRVAVERPAREQPARGRTGFAILHPAPCPSGALDFGPLPAGPCELTITPTDPHSRLAPVSIAIRGGDLAVNVALRYRA